MFQNTVQIAGVKSQQEAWMLEKLGVDFIGFPLRLGYHAPDISEEQAAEIIKQMQQPKKAVLITYLTSAEQVSDFCSTLGSTIVQLHAEISPLEVKKLKKQRPDLTIIKSLIVCPDLKDNLRTLLNKANCYQDWVDAFITDTYDPRTTACGATGLAHDWTVSKELSALLTKPLILAGGLKPDNVYAAITQVRPAAVDAHSGVENAAGDKSEKLLTEFIKEARRAFHDLSK